MGQSKHDYGRRVVYRHIELLDDSGEEWSSARVIDHKPAPDGRHCVESGGGVKKEEWVDLRERNWRFKEPYAEVKRSLLEYFRVHAPSDDPDDDPRVDGILQNPAFINDLTRLSSNLKANFKAGADFSGIAFPDTDSYPLKLGSNDAQKM